MMLEKIDILKENGKRKLFCGYCHLEVKRSIVMHLRKHHPDLWEQACQKFVELRNDGLSYKQIMRKFRTLFTWKVIEKEIKRMVCEKKATLRPKWKEKLQWEPENFKLEATTLWNFPNRGDWAVHQGDYRGNWAPQVVRNLLLRYSAKGDLVLDPFVGGGTTLIECWLLGRNGIGIDINPEAIAITKCRLNEMEEAAKKMHYRLPKVKIKVRKGDARNLHYIEPNSIDLICAHPPYADAIQYTLGEKGDFSCIHDINNFCDEIEEVARNLYLRLKPGKFCVVMIGDIRRNGAIVPLGFLVMDRFFRAGFKLQEIIVKTQHHEMASIFYLKNRDMLRIAHEYIFVFLK
jgi:DNA modification methylase